MNELEPLEALAKIKKHDIHKTLINKKFVMDKEWEENYQIIEKELKEKEQYEKILNDYGLTLADFREACILLTILKGEGRNIHNIDKQLKALEIIKEFVFVDYDTGDFVIKIPNDKQQEYELLKEVLL